MGISSDEARALAFIAALIGLTLLGRWVDRPRPVGVDQPVVDVVELAARSEAALAAREGRSVAAGTARATTAPVAATSRPGQGRSESQSGPLDLNAATAAELERLPGIGPALAGRIVAYRDSVGRFRTVEELDSVKGIGPAMLARLTPLLRL